MMQPSAAPNILLSPVADGIVAYDPTSDQLHRLNSVAALILEFCDGRRTVGEIAAAVAPFLPDEADSVVGEWIDEAMRAGLLVDRSSTAAGHQEFPQILTADALVELVDRLREQGKVRTAFICQQRAAELTPDDVQVLRTLGELAHIVGDRKEARDAYAHYLVLEPDDAEIAHLLTALRDDPAPKRVPNECIEQLYERFSSFYDENLYNELGSEIPGRLAELVQKEIGNAHGLAVLDLGCGTGVSGGHIQDVAAHLVGVDLSPEMIEKARERGIYDRLDVAEITAWLRQCDESFDVIVASDSFIYFGDLAQVIVPATRVLNPGGAIAFSVEACDDARYRLSDSGRYVHHRDHVHSVAALAGLTVTRVEQAFLRMEYGEEVEGLYVILSDDGR